MEKLLLLKCRRFKRKRERKGEKGKGKEGTLTFSALLARLSEKKLREAPIYQMTRNRFEGCIHHPAVYWLLTG